MVSIIFHSREYYHFDNDPWKGNGWAGKLENTWDYFIAGTYSDYDLAAILLGGVTAYGILILTQTQREAGYYPING